MSSSSSSPKLPARAMIAFDDAELDKFFEERKRKIAVGDPHSLPEEFFEKLRDRVNRASEVAISRPVDPDQRAEYEREPIPDWGENPPRRRSVSTVAFDEEEDRRQLLQEETESYHALVEDGGRPSHPLDLPRDFFKDPGEYHEIVSFWKDRDGLNESLFTSQMNRWKDFRRFQRFMRERDIEDQRVIRIYSGYGPSVLMEWYTFVGYYQPLDEDPTRQSSLTEWIEYLGYEYWWHDQFVLSERQQKWFDKKWQVVVDSQVLRPSETPESVRGFDTVMLEYRRLKQAQEAVETAKSAVLSAQKVISNPQNLRHPAKDPKQKLLEAQSELTVAEKNCEFLEHRQTVIADFCHATGELQLLKEYAVRHTILLRWIMEQLSMIEPEMKQYAPVKPSSEEPGRGKPNFDQVDHPNPGEGFRDQTKNDMEDLMALGLVMPTAASSQEKGEFKHSYGILNEEHPSKRPRRSIRNNSLSICNISESVAASAATEVHYSNRSPVMKTRLKRRAAIMTAEGEKVRKEVDEFFNQDNSIEKRVSKRRKLKNQIQTISEYNILSARDTITVAKAANEESQNFKPSTSMMTKHKRKVVSMALEEEKDVKTNKVSTRRSSLHTKKNMLLSSTIAQPLRRSLRLAQKRAAI
ncbi:hypothetical protein AJ78_00061 [Emergomyces pasteurianus Ep9510]|uniref:Uncharacterized protein n=1 Tax=Emergomyces pasteurianus Ep9510 TaxID=1447872 RepID=A0A1J9QXJ5_9EURO|nr:hypothetical protein AJ78_00061 [Emergomyces pasteurianus Ep9510]